jgi:hypothetical protein
LTKIRNFFKRKSVNPKPKGKPMAEIKNLTNLEVKVGERIYRLLCEVDSPLGEVHDVITQMKALVVQKINEAHTASLPPETSPIETSTEGC